MFMPGWFPAGASRITPQYNLVEANVVTNDQHDYSRTFTCPNVRPDRKILVVSATGKNSGTSVFVDQTLQSAQPAYEVTESVGKAIGAVGLWDAPTGTSFDFFIDLDSSQGAWAFACFEVWGLHGSPKIATRTGVGNLAVPADGLLFTGSAGDEPHTLTGQTSLATSDGSDVSRRVAFKPDFRIETTFNVAATNTQAPFALAAMSIR